MPGRSVWISGAKSSPWSDAALGEDGPQPHVHAVLGLPDGATRGGHLLEEHVWPTLEVAIRETDAGLRKTYRPQVGLALIDLDR